MYGTIGLETAFGALNTIFTMKKTIDLLTKGRERYGIESTSIAVGKNAKLTLFNPTENYTFQKNMILSSSKNAIFENYPLKGKVYGVFSNDQLVLN